MEEKKTLKFKKSLISSQKQKLPWNLIAWTYYSSTNKYNNYAYLSPIHALKTVVFYVASFLSIAIQNEAVLTNFFALIFAVV